MANGMSRLGFLFALGLGLAACASDAPEPAAVVPAPAAPSPAASALNAGVAVRPWAADVEQVLLELKANQQDQVAGAEAAVVLPARRTAAEDLPPLPARPAGTVVSYLLLDLDSGETLAELDPGLPLIPASTVKLATALVALDVLGPEHRFRTELLAAGRVRDGRLEGNLILRGGGDPVLDIADLLELAVRLENRGIHEVTGRFLVDDTALPRFSEIEPSQPLEAAYNPSIGALSLAFNRVRVAWRGGGQVDALTLPPLEGKNSSDGEGPRSGCIRPRENPHSRQEAIRAPIP